MIKSCIFILLITFGCVGIAAAGEIPVDPGLVYASAVTTGDYSPVPPHEIVGPGYISETRAVDLFVRDKPEGTDSIPGSENLIPSHIHIQNPLPPTPSYPSAISPSCNPVTIHDFMVPQGDLMVPSPIIGISPAYVSPASHQTNYDIENSVYPVVPSYSAQAEGEGQITSHFDSSLDDAETHSGEPGLYTAVNDPITPQISTPSDNISREEAIEIAQEIEGFYVTGIFEAGLKTVYTNNNELELVWNVRVLATKEKPVPGVWSPSYLFGVVIDAQTGEILRIDSYYGSTVQR